MAGVESVRRGLKQPIGSLTQMNTIRLGKRTESRAPLIKDFVPLANLEDLVFGAWDPIPDDAYTSAQVCGVLRPEDIDPLADFLSGIEPMPAVFDSAYVKKLDGPNVKQGENKRDLAEQLREDIRRFKEENGCDRLVMMWAASTEIFLRPTDVHATVESFEKAMEEDDPAIAPSMLYAWAALNAGCAFLNFTPSNACITPAHVKLAQRRRLPLMGNDGKTGETLVKSALAPMFKYRNLQVLTWQGYNILGDRDGEVLAEEQNKASKISSKDGVLSSILGYPLHTHVAIDYAPSLSDLKTAWDFIHFRGFLDYKMSLQFIWQGCDAILAAPIVIDMVRLLDFAKRHGEHGLMTQLACFFKRPLGVEEQDLHFQFHHLMAYLAEHAARKREGLAAVPTAAKRKPPRKRS